MQQQQQAPQQGHPQQPPLLLPLSRHRRPSHDPVDTVIAVNKLTSFIERRRKNLAQLLRGFDYERGAASRGEISRGDLAGLLGKLPLQLTKQQSLALLDFADIEGKGAVNVKAFCRMVAILQQRQRDGHTGHDVLEMPRDVVFPNWLIARADFRLVFPRFAPPEERNHDAATEAALRKKPFQRVHEDLQNIANWLAERPAFEALGAQRCLEFASVVRMEDHPVGKLIFEQGSSSDAFYVVYSGFVDVEVDNVRVACLGPGATFGEMGLDSNAARMASVRAAGAPALGSTLGGGHTAGGHGHAGHGHVSPQGTVAGAHSAGHTNGWAPIANAWGHTAGGGGHGAHGWLNLTGTHNLMTTGVHHHHNSTAVHKQGGAGAHAPGSPGGHGGASKGHHSPRGEHPRSSTGAHGHHNRASVNGRGHNHQGSVRPHGAHNSGATVAAGNGGPLMPATGVAAAVAAAAALVAQDEEEDKPNISLVSMLLSDYKHIMSKMNAAKMVRKVELLTTRCRFAQSWSASKVRAFTYCMAYQRHGHGSLVYADADLAHTFYIIAGGTAVLQRKLLYRLSNRWPRAPPPPSPSSRSRSSSRSSSGSRSASRSGSYSRSSCSSSSSDIESDFGLPTSRPGSRGRAMTPRRRAGRRPGSGSSPVRPLSTASSARAGGGGVGQRSTAMSRGGAAACNTGDSLFDGSSVDSRTELRTVQQCITVNLKTVGLGETFGEDAALGYERRQYQVVATSAVLEVFAVARDAIQTYLTAAEVEAVARESRPIYAFAEGLGQSWRYYEAIQSHRSVARRKVAAVGPNYSHRKAAAASPPLPAPPPPPLPPLQQRKSGGARLAPIGVDVGSLKGGYMKQLQPIHSL